MNTLKIISASFLIAAASTAFAGSDDGNVDSFPAVRSAAVQTAPAPTAAAAQVKLDNSKQAGFLQQQSEVSGN
ncbi:MAG TPA: hypothetical protein VGN52_23720 [Burkholderiales bacterium]|jgi:hypothetical protein